MRKHNTPKKLSLTTDTVRNLQDSELVTAAGAGGSGSPLCRPSYINCTIPSRGMICQQ